MSLAWANSRFALADLSGFQAILSWPKILLASPSEFVYFLIKDVHSQMRPLSLTSAGALRVLAEDPEVLLDVGGDVHHAGADPGLHLPV